MLEKNPADDGVPRADDEDSSSVQRSRDLGTLQRRRGVRATRAEKRLSLTSAPGRILLVDDDQLFLQATARFLRHHGFDVECHGTVSGARGALEVRPFELIVTDFQLPDGTGIDVLRYAAEQGLDSSAIVVTGMPSVDSAVGALRLGAADYLVKPFHSLDLVERAHRGVDASRVRRQVSDARSHTHHLEQMLSALRLVLDGSGHTHAVSPTRAPAGLAGPVMRGLNGRERETLSTRELEVLTQMVSGKSPKDIASALFISHHTVRNHLRSIYSKLDVHSQLELVRKVAG